MIVFAAMYHALTVAPRCYHRDRSVTYVSCAIVCVVLTFALTRSVWKKIAVTLCVRKTRAAYGRKNALTLLVQKADAVAHAIRTTFALTICVCKTRAASGRKNALTLLVRKADAVTHAVRTTFALTLCVRKE